MLALGRREEESVFVIDTETGEQILEVKVLGGGHCTLGFQATLRYKINRGPEVRPTTIKPPGGS